MGLEVIERPIDPNRPDSPMIVLVDKVARNSPAAMSGLREGMAIVQIFRTPVRSLAEFHETIAQFNAMQGIPLGVKTPEGNDMVILLRAAAGGP
jgi:S1-C subfamily serine protease